jgi:segregation and condensation protein A
VSEKIEALRRWISAEASLRFSCLFERSTSRSEVVATFLALLELMRLKVLRVVQNEPFGEIDIQRLEPSSPPAGGAAPTADTAAPVPVSGRP